MKAVRKIACVMTAIVLLCSFFSMSAMAADAAIGVESDVVTADDSTQLVVTVSIPANLEVGGASVRLSYDTGKLTVVAAESGTLPSAIVNAENEGEIRGNFFSAEACSAGGVLYTVTFDYAADAVADAADVSVDKFSLSDIDGNDFPDVVVNYTFAGETMEVEAVEEEPQPMETEDVDSNVDDEEETPALEPMGETPESTDNAAEPAQEVPEASVIEDDSANEGSAEEPTGETVSGTRIALILLCGIVFALAVVVLCVHFHNKNEPRGKHQAH